VPRVAAIAAGVWALGIAGMLVFLHSVRIVRDPLDQAARDSTDSTDSTDPITKEHAE
jgi:hypothetical protein